MSTGFFKVPKAKNEVVKSYIPGSKERDEIQKTYKEMINSFTEVPMYINGKDVKSQNKNKLALHTITKILLVNTTSPNLNIMMKLLNQH